MKNWKKNLIAAAVLVTVCTGIYLNWLYTEQSTASDLTDTLDTEKVMSDDALILNDDTAVIADGEDAVDTATDYFAAVPPAGERQCGEPAPGNRRHRG